MRFMHAVWRWWCVVSPPGWVVGVALLFYLPFAGLSVFFFVADAAWLKRSIVENRPPHKIADMLFPDPIAYRETLGKLQTYYLTHPDTIVVPSHCDETISQLSASGHK